MILCDIKTPSISCSIVLSGPDCNSPEVILKDACTCGCPYIYIYLENCDCVYSLFIFK